MSAILQTINAFFCWFGAVLDNPGGFLNSFVNFLISSISAFFVFSTPESLKLSSLINSVYSADPILGWFASQVFLGLLPFIIAKLAISLWMMLPFT